MGKILWRWEWQPSPVLLPGESHGRRSLLGYSPWGCRVRLTEQLSTCTEPWGMRRQTWGLPGSLKLLWWPRETRIKAIVDFYPKVCLQWTSVDWRQSFNFLTTVLESLCILNFYFWSCWVTVAVLELPLIAGRDWGLSWLCSQLLISLASLVAEHRLSVPGLSCPEACGIFPVQTCVLCIGRWTLIHRTIRAVTYMSNIHY